MQFAPCRPLKSFMILAGFWPVQYIPKKFQIIYLIHSWFSLFILGTMPVSMLIATGKVRRRDLASHFGVCLIYITTTLKLQLVNCAATQRFIVTSQSDEDRFSEDDNEDIRGFYQEVKRKTKILFVLFFLWYFFTEVSYDLSRYMMFIRKFDDGLVCDKGCIYTQKPLSHEQWLPINREKHYNELLLYQLLASLQLTVTTLSSDTMFLAMVLRGIGMLKILDVKIRNFDEGCDVGNEEDEEKAFQRIRECVIFHQDIISFINDIDSVLNKVMLGNFITVSMHIALIIFQVMQTTSAFDGLFLFALAVTIGFQFFLYWYANEIRIHSTNLNHAIYESNWFNHNEKLKKMLILMLLRTSRPLTLHVASLCELSMEVLLQTLKTIYSCLAVLNGMK